MTELFEKATSTLQSLRDLNGIFGSFLVADSGDVVAQDLPAYFGAAACEIGPRAQRLQEALSLNQGPLNQCVLRYGEHKISLRPVKGGLLTIIASSDVNLPALRMASNLVAKKLPRLSSLPSPSTPPSIAANVAPPSSERIGDVPTKAGERAPSEPPKRTARAVYFRGKRIR